MKKEEYIEHSEERFLHVYNRFKLVLDRGEGVRLYDTDGKEYLDFGAGIAVYGLGYSNEKYKTALKEQIDKLCHTSNLFYNVPVMNAAEKLTSFAGMDRVFFTNSGAEAIEGAIKCAKRYGFTRDSHGGHEIIAMKDSFHGRTIGALSVTGNDHYREPFEPLMPGVKFAEYNNLDSVKALMSDKTIAVIMETVQGEGGIHPAKQEFIEGVRKLCDERDALLILDEIQCGMCRTGYPFAWQGYGVRPDIMTVAKAIGNGVPVGAFLLDGRLSDKTLLPGDHGTTYGGNPLIGAAVSTTVDIMRDEDFCSHVKKVGAYLENTLSQMVEKYDHLKAQRGVGLMRGLVFDGKPSEVVTAALEEGLIVLSAGSDVIRLVPPLVINEADVDEMAEKLGRALEAVAG